MATGKPTINFKLVAVKLGEGLKNAVSANEITRIARAVFSFDVMHHPCEGITSSTFQLVYDWVMTLAMQPIEEAEKLALLDQFVASLAPKRRDLVKSAPRPSP